MAALAMTGSLVAVGPRTFSVRQAAPSSVSGPSSAASRLPRLSLGRRGAVVAMSTAPKSSEMDLEEQIRRGIKDAETTCADPNHTEECAVAWDEVEEMSAAAADAKYKKKQPEVSDPLEAFCAENPETDECRVYSD